MKNTFLLSLILGVLVSGCGDIAKIGQSPKECPMTIEHDIFVPRNILEGEAETTAYEWDNEDTYTVIEGTDDGDYMTVSVFEGDCETQIYYFYPTD